MSDQTRRDFLKSSIGAVLSTQVGATISFNSPHGAAAAGRAAIATLPVKKGLVLSMLPPTLSFVDRFKLARDTGFEIIQAPTTPNQAKPKKFNAPRTRPAS